METFSDFLISLIASLIAVYCTLWIENLKLPKLEIEIDESDRNANYENESWLFYKIIVTNLPTKFLPKLIKRQTAENCHAFIKFYQNNIPLFSINGRWSSTPQLPEMPIDQWKVIAAYQQPISIFSGKYEKLDIITKCASDLESYAFNNSSYLHSWKNENYKLEPGEYQIQVDIYPQNGPLHIFKLKLYVSDINDDTKLSIVT